MNSPSQPPCEMTVGEFTRWRIQQEMQAGSTVRAIAKSLGVSRWTVRRIILRCNLHHSDNSDDVAVENS